MRIAQLAPVAERVPPKGYGGTERIVYELTEDLVRRGHAVTLFASGDAITHARLVSVYPRALRESSAEDVYGLNIYTLLNIGMAYAMQDEFDVIHDHSGHLSLPTANMAHVPVVMTYHGPFTTPVVEMFQKLSQPWVASISRDQVAGVTGIHYAETVYNGLSMDEYPFGTNRENFLLFVGRISVEKGVHYAVRVAKRLQKPLIIAAKCDPADRPYFDRFIKSHLSDTIQWIGEVDEATRNDLMSRALCFLHPVTFREPFGLTLIEAMACGCPVIAFKRGSIPEIVVHKKTGFIVKTVAEMIAGVRNIGQIDPAACRAHVLRHFTAKRMVDQYEKIYRALVHKKTPSALSAS